MLSVDDGRIVVAGAPLATYAEPRRPFTGQIIGQSSRDP
jgi:hypothetical protein